MCEERWADLFIEEEVGVVVDSQAVGHVSRCPRATSREIA